MVQAELGAAQGVDDDARGVGGVHCFQLEVDVEGDIAETAAFERMWDAM